MAQFVKLDPTALKQLRTVDERLVSYNVEMTEVTGGCLSSCCNFIPRKGGYRL